LEDPSPLFHSLLLLDIFKPLTISGLISLLILIILLLFSALISGSEVAFFSLTPSEKEELEEEKSKSADYISKLLNTPKKLLATILISNNFINVGIIIISGFAIDTIFDLSSIPEWLNFLIQVIGITFVLLLFGEVIPKVYATKNANKLAHLMASPLTILKKLVSPFSAILIYSTSIFDKKIKKKSLDISVEELSQALDLTDGIPENKEEHKILKGIVKFGETSVKQVMKPRLDVVAIKNDTSFTDVINTIMDSGHSRIPIYEDSFDKILGLLYIKDLIPFIDEKENYDWTPLIRNPFFVPENKKLDDLLKEFQDKKIHLAIVVDEYGGTSGIITLEDVLEEIVGEIKDEFDTDEVAYSKLDENTYVFDGKTGLNDIDKILNLSGENLLAEITTEADTLAGLVIEVSGKIPQKNEKISIPNFTFIVEAADKRRIKRIKLIQKINETS